MITNGNTALDNVYDLVVNGIHYGSWNLTFNPQYLYFNDQATGHGGVGDWGDPLNWWSDINATVHAGHVPRVYENAIVNNGNIISNSAISADVNTIVFNGASVNLITINATNGATFNGSSINLGTINSTNNVQVFFNGSSSNSGTTTYPISVIGGGLTGYWKLNESASGTAPLGTDFLDSTGNGNNGVAHGNIVYGVGGQNNSNGITLNGTDSYVDVGNPDSLKLQYFTATAWIKYTHTNGSFIFSHGNNSGGSGWGINIDDTGFGFDDAWIHQLFFYNVNIHDGAWHQVGIYRDTNNNVGLILDGQIVAQGNYANTFGFSNLQIGARGGGNIFNGSIDQFAVWNRALSTTEIKEIYNGGINGIGNIISSATFVGDLSNDNGKLSLANLTGTWTKRDTSGQRNWNGITSSSDGTKLAATVYGGYIYTSTDSGATWVERTSSGARGWGSITSSFDGVKLAAIADDGNVYTSNDSGASWTQINVNLRWTQMVGSADGTELIAGTWDGYVWMSKDSGATWSQVPGLGYGDWYEFAMSPDGKHIAATNIYYGNYIYTSNDSGSTWNQRTFLGAKDNWAGIAISDDGLKLAVNVGVRFGSGLVYTSVDNGVTWTQRDSAGQRNWTAIRSSPDGNSLVSVASGDYIRYSNDGGITWTPLTSLGAHSWSVNALTSSGSGNFATAAYGDYIYTYIIPANVNHVSLVRLFTEAASTSRNFLTDGGFNTWTIIAQGAVVDITNAIYDTATNVFKALIDPISVIDWLLQ